MRTALQGLVGSAAVGAALFCLASFQTPQAAEKEKADFKNYVETIPGTKVTFEMIAVPGGTYMRGSPEGEKGRKADEGPQHPIAVKPFWMGKCEVTWDEFDIYRKEKGVEAPIQNDEIIKANPDAITGPTPPYVDETYGHPREGHPALCMTHHCAMEYCRWLSQKTGKLYRLPTEAEWEYACRAGTNTAYCFGDDPEGLGEYAWYVKNSEDLTHKVGTKKANAFGLHDMHGNVMEWCVDHYKENYKDFPLDKPTLNPVNLPSKARFSHVARGGSWADEADMCRSAARRGSDVSWMRDDPQRPRSIWWLTNFDIIGFRVVRPVEEQPNLKNLRSLVTRESPLN